MPLRVFSARCPLEHTLELAPRSGATLATTVRGVYAKALVTMGFAWLRAPRSEAQRRDHPSPLVLRVTGRDAGRSEARGAGREAIALGTLELSLTLLGRKALSHANVAIEALHRAGRAGLTQKSIRFEPTLELTFDGTFAEWTASARAASMNTKTPSPRKARIDLVTPMDADVHDFPRILGDAAHDLVQWDLADSDLADRIGREMCDTLGDRARKLAAETLRDVTLRADVTFEELGLRRSRSNGQRFPLQGYLGSIELSGPLDAALPWLGVLELRGGGGRKTFGMGEVRVWVGE